MWQLLARGREAARAPPTPSHPTARGDGCDVAGTRGTCTPRSTRTPEEVGGGGGGGGGEGASVVEGGLAERCGALLLLDIERARVTCAPLTTDGGGRGASEEAADRRSSALMDRVGGDTGSMVGVFIKGKCLSSLKGTSMDWTDHWGRGRENISSNTHCAQHTSNAGLEPRTKYAAEKQISTTKQR